MTNQNLVYKVRRLMEDAGMIATIDLSTVSAQTLRKAADILEKRAELQAEFDAIFNVPAHSNNGHTKRKRKPLNMEDSITSEEPVFRSKKTARVYEELKDAGPKGMTVQDLSKLTKQKVSTLHTFLSKSVGKLPGLERKGPGHYAVDL